MRIFQKKRLTLCVYWTGRSHIGLRHCFGGVDVQRGGYSSEPTPDVRMTWNPRCGHAVATFDDEVVVIGGLDATGLRNDAWASSDGCEWRRIGDGPARVGQAAVALADQILVFGGCDDRGTCRSDVHSWDGLAWAELPEAPWESRCYLSAARGRTDGAAVIFCGSSSRGVCRDAWQTEDAGRTWTMLPAPPWIAREQAAAVRLDVCSA